MMLDLAFKLRREAEAITEAVEKSVESGFVTVDLNPENPKSTSEVGTWISDYIRKDS